MSGPSRSTLSTLRKRSASPAFRPVCCSTKRATCAKPSPTRLKSRLKAKSSVKYSSQMRAALLLQPKSFSSSV